ncbi:MAG: precorrin-2 C(20)-methyltransferase [Candidatus Omnitrophica bacterium]|nr:precorrin-2 C(20)-methyltransferase [Candidatus Omnitrophota bacterium]
MKVYIIGAGPGAEDYLLPIARSRIEKSDCLIGAGRLLDLFRHLGKEEIRVQGRLADVVGYIKQHRRKKRIAVLVSGDPGIYSLLGMLSKALRPREYTVIPGISALQLAFARIGETWNDAKIISLHGRKGDNLTGEIAACAKAFLFTDADFPPDKIAARLLKDGLENRRAVILENLSYPDERIIDTDLKRLKGKKGWGLCAMIVLAGREGQGKLYGIGIGPGDPKLITLKAKEALDRSDVVFVPKGSDDGTSCARSIVEAVTTKQKTFVELTFPMTKDRAILNKYWGKAAGIIAKEVRKGKEAAFVTIGDPFIYSTYIYLLKTLREGFPDIKIETIPGISAFNAAAAAAKFALVEGDERMAVIPVTKDLRGLRESLLEFDTVVLMKVGSKLDSVISLLKELRLARHATLICRVGHKDERIIRDLTSFRDKKAGYLSVIIVKRRA